jgi:hypothetical protein
MKSPRGENVNDVSFMTSQSGDNVPEGAAGQAVSFFRFRKGK